MYVPLAATQQWLDLSHWGLLHLRPCLPKEVLTARRRRKESSFFPSKALFGEKTALEAVFSTSQSISNRLKAALWAMLCQGILGCETLAATGDRAEVGERAEQLGHSLAEALSC